MEHRWCRPKDESFYPKVHSSFSGKPHDSSLSRLFTLSVFSAFRRRLSTSKKVKVRISLSLCLKANNISPQIIHEMNTYARVCTVFFLFLFLSLLRTAYYLWQEKRSVCVFDFCFGCFWFFGLDYKAFSLPFFLLSWQLFFILAWNIQRTRYLVPTNSTACYPRRCFCTPPLSVGQARAFNTS